MTKLTNQKLPKHPMEYCKICKEWVPSLNKHNRKRHKKLK